MSTDDEKLKIAKLLDSLAIEEPEVKLSERCFSLIKDFHEKFDKEIEEEELEMTKFINEGEEDFANPYKVDKELLEENERKLKEVLLEYKRIKKESSSTKSTTLSTEPDPKRPWRINSNKEKIVRINNELKHHHEKATQKICPLQGDKMKELIEECREEAKIAPEVSANRLRDTIDDAKKNLPNFQYRKVDNTTATEILATAHGGGDGMRKITDKDDDGQVQ